MERVARLKAANTCVQCGSNPATHGIMCLTCRLRSKANQTKRRHNDPVRHRGYKQAFMRKKKEQAYRILGAKCNCCGESNKMFLTVDHVNNDGYKDKQRRRSLTYLMYIEIVRNTFPGKYQILCWNCNCGKRTNGGTCPHKEI